MEISAQEAANWIVRLKHGLQLVTLSVLELALKVPWTCGQKSPVAVELECKIEFRGRAATFDDCLRQPEAVRRVVEVAVNFVPMEFAVKRLVAMHVAEERRPDERAEDAPVP